MVFRLVAPGLKIDIELSPSQLLCSSNCQFSILKEYKVSTKMVLGREWVKLRANGLWKLVHELRGLDNA